MPTAAATQYFPKYAVWELTFACNMRCRHCGSGAGGVRNRRHGELSTERALELCDELAALGNERITLSGGELLLRRDWDQIAAAGGTSQFYPGNTQARGAGGGPCGWPIHRRRGCRVEATLR